MGWALAGPDESALALSVPLPDDLVRIVCQIGPVPERVEIRWSLEGVSVLDAVARCRATMRRGDVVQTVDVLMSAKPTFSAMLRAATTLLLYDDIVEDDEVLFSDDEPFLVIPNDPEFWQDVCEMLVRADRR